MVGDQRKYTRICDGSSNQGSEKSRYTMAPNDIWFEALNNFSRSKGSGNVEKRVEESCYSECFCPGSFGDFPPKDLYFIPLQAEYFCDRLHVCFYAPEKGDIIGCDKDFFLYPLVSSLGTAPSIVLAYTSRLSVDMYGKEWSS